jgi:DNA-directed RNA polymerase subunit beta'
MALELFKPFIYHKLEEKGLATTIKGAKKMVEKEKREVWDILEEVIKEHPVLLNRAPTLHRLGIQAFWPVLIEGKAIRLHPLVCIAFNADFDGDQMAVHVPLSKEAQREAIDLMLATKNVLSPAHGRPLATPSQDIVLGCYYLTKPSAIKPKKMRIFADAADVRCAYDADVIDLHEQIKVRMGGEGEFVETTSGRIIMSEILPPEIPFDLVNKTMRKKELSDLINYSFRKHGLELTTKLLDEVKAIGFRYATHAGVSVSIEDMRVPEKKKELVAAALADIDNIGNQYAEGLITKGEKYNKVIDLWAQTTDKVGEELLHDLEEVKPGESASRKGFNPIFIMLDSGARGSKQQIRQLAGMRGLMAKPSGEILETPIISNFRDGLNVLEYFISTHGARKGLADTALKTANSGYLTRRLVDVAQDVIITEVDCHTLDGIEVESILENGEVIEPLKERILGRVALEDIVEDPDKPDNILVRANTEITEDIADRIEQANIDRVKIRSVLTCKTREGVCGFCYGRDLARGKMVNMGEAVGVIAAQSIGEPGTQLTMRTFHIGGTASHMVDNAIEAKNDGVIRYSAELRWAVNKDKDNIVMNRNGYVIVEDATGREREKHLVVYGAKLRVKNGQKVKAGQPLVGWDPYTTPILAEASGKVKFGDLVEGETVKEEVDPTTLHAQKIIVPFQDPDKRPRVSVKDAKNNTIGRHNLPVRAIIYVNEGEEVVAGDIIAKIPRETTKTKDITGGLPRVAELFEARKPKEQAIISEIDGTVRKVEPVKGKGLTRVLVTADVDGQEYEYLVPKGKHVNVRENDIVKSGEQLMDGSPNPHEILRVKGVDELQKYLVKEIQEVYSLQGVKINDKHIEVIVRQMLRKYIVEDVGDTELLLGEQIDKFRFEEIKEETIGAGLRPPSAKPVLMGITKASLATESFISAASFQETTRVLTEAAIGGKVDLLKGLKENVIMGRLIPAGTGFMKYRQMQRAAEALGLGEGDGETSAVAEMPKSDE